jgi:hypothetical protein
METLVCTPAVCHQMALFPMDVEVSDSISSDFDVVYV